MKKIFILIFWALAWGNEYEVTVRPDPDHKGIYKVFVRDIIAEKRELVLTSNKIVATHPHPAEYHKGNLYILQYGKKNMELWKYGNKQEILATGKFLSFRVSRDDKYCVVTDGKTVSIITPSGKRELPYKRFLGRSEISSATGVALIKWSANDQLLWGAVLTGKQTTSLWTFDRNNWRNIERYPIRGLAVQQEYALHTDTLRILYSTPADPNKHKLSLRWYDLQKNTGGEIISANVGYYAPRWIDKNYMDFIPPSRKGRVMYNIQ